MSVVPQISYHNAAASPALDRLINAEAAKLERFFDRIVSCRVLVEHTHRQRQRSSPFSVRIELGVPGELIVVNSGPDVRPETSSGEDEAVRVSAPEHDADNYNVQLAIRDAFHKLERRLREHVRRRAGR